MVGIPVGSDLFLYWYENKLVRKIRKLDLNEKNSWNDITGFIRRITQHISECKLGLSTCKFVFMWN